MASYANVFSSALAKVNVRFPSPMEKLYYVYLRSNTLVSVYMQFQCLKTKWVCESLISFQGMLCLYTLYHSTCSESNGK